MKPIFCLIILNSAFSTVNLSILNSFPPSFGVRYQTHLESIGWQQGWMYNGEMAGTTGQSRRLEAIRIQLVGAPEGTRLRYSAHCQDIGWQGWRKGGDIAGTVGERKQMEAIKIKFLYKPNRGISIQYKVHLQDLGWQGWVDEGQVAGTMGQNRRLEAIQIRIVNI